MHALKFIPKSRPEELNPVSLADRVNQLLANTLDRYVHVAENLELQDKIRILETSAISTKVHIIKSNDVTSAKVAVVTSRDGKECST